MSVLEEGNAAVLLSLKSSGNLVRTYKHIHRYPYDWRSKSPVIFRTTPQWFLKLDALRDSVIKAIDDIRMYPEAGRSRLKAFVKSRSEWCLSRQRAWGVPLPAFYHIETGEALLTSETIAHVQDLVAKHGSDCWWTMQTADLLPPRYRSSAHLWKRGDDTLDVWFDSGCSWAGALQDAPTSHCGHVADLYLEGSDQHRGWFQSSLLTHVAAKGPAAGAPYKCLITHGFVVDESGTKMSKSLGNVLTPRDLIDGAVASTAGQDGGKEKSWEAGKLTKKERKAMRQAALGKGYGAEVLRWWVASSDFTRDVSVGSAVLEQSREAHRKIRNTCRFMLGNLYDFRPGADSVPLHKLRKVDRLLLHELAKYSSEVQRAYGDFAFNRVVVASQQLASESLSAGYFDSVRDRLYCGKSDGLSRRSAQTTLYHALEVLILSISPLLPFLAEEVYEQWPGKKSGVSACDLAGQVEVPGAPAERIWSGAPSAWYDDELASYGQAMSKVKGVVARLVHAESLIRGEMVVQIGVEYESEIHRALEYFGYERNDFLLVAGSRLCVQGMASRRNHSAYGTVLSYGYDQDKQLAASTIHLQSNEGDKIQNVDISLHALDGDKCPRCWRHMPKVPILPVEADCVMGQEFASDVALYRGCACRVI